MITHDFGTHHSIWGEIYYAHIENGLLAFGKSTHGTWGDHYKGTYKDMKGNLAMIFKNGPQSMYSSIVKYCEEQEAKEAARTNAAYYGYAMMAMERAGLDATTIKKVSRQMTQCLSDTSVKAAERYYLEGRH